MPPCVMANHRLFLIQIWCLIFVFLMCNHFCSVKPLELWFIFLFAGYWHKLLYVGPYMIFAEDVLNAKTSITVFCKMHDLTNLTSTQYGKFDQSKYKHECGFYRYLYCESSLSDTSCDLLFMTYRIIKRCCCWCRCSTFTVFRCLVRLVSRIKSYLPLFSWRL